MLPLRDESGSSELYTLEQVQQLTGYSRTTIWRRLSRNDGFPKPVLPHRLLWRRSAIDDWLSGGQPANPLIEHAAPSHPSIMQAIEAGRFPAWFAEMWTENGFAGAYGCDRRWLEDLGGRVEAAMRGNPETREDRLQDLQRELVKECRRGAHKRAAEFFLQWAASLHLDAVRARSGPSWETKLARAFYAAVAAIRREREAAREAGVALECLNVVDLQAVAEIVSRHDLRGEGISCTDVLTALKVHTAVIPLREWVGEATSKH